MSKITDGFDIGLYGDAEVRELFAHTRALEAMLRKHEWVNMDGWDDEACPCCERWRRDGHSPDCELAKLLD